MNAIRRDEITDNIHSIFVDQWDWGESHQAGGAHARHLKGNGEHRIQMPAQDRKIHGDPVRLHRGDPAARHLFVTTEELAEMFPDNTPKEREYYITKTKGAVCILKIGDTLENGEPHDGRAPDYDDWALNADILYTIRYLTLPLSFLPWNPRGQKKPCCPSLKRQAVKTARSFVPEGDHRRRASLHHRRRYRSVPYLYVFPAQGAHRRGAVLPVAG